MRADGGADGNLFYGVFIGGGQLLVQEKLGREGHDDKQSWGD